MTFKTHASRAAPPSSSGTMRSRGAEPAGSQASPPALWDIDDVATFLGVTKQTIYTWRTTGYGPAGFRVGKHLKWRPSTVIAWTVRLEEHQQV